MITKRNTGTRSNKNSEKIFITIVVLLIIAVLTPTILHSEYNKTKKTDFFGFANYELTTIGATELKLESTNNTNTTTEDINCIAELYDPDNEQINITIQWYKNNILEKITEYNNNYESKTLFTATLYTNELQTGDTWNCAIQLTNTEHTSEWQQSNNITITEQTTQNKTENTTTNNNEEIIITEKNNTIENTTTNNNEKITQTTTKENNTTENITNTEENNTIQNTTNENITYTNTTEKNITENSTNKNTTNTIKSAGILAINTYYIANTGNDSNDGLTQSTPWKTLSKINNQTFQPGDTILFKRGDTFRGSIYQTEHGTSTNRITYGAYGSGNKPLILASKDLSLTNAWTSYSTNIWRTTATLGTSQNDISNMIFNNETVVGIKVASIAECNAQGKFFYNETDHLLYIYSTSNPGTYYTHIEACGENSIAHGNFYFYDSSYITIQNLDFRYSSAAGIEFQQCDNIILEYCDVSWIGGEYLNSAHDYRLGNGISLWMDNTNFDIRYNRVNQCYDAGISPQGGGTYTQANISIYYNIISNSWYSYEIFSYAGSTINNVNFDNNLCMDPAGSWSTSQRPDTNNARHVVNWQGATGTVTNSNIRNNIFEGSAVTALRFDGVIAFNLDYNLYNVSTVGIFGSTNYNTLAQWKTATSKDNHSISGDPLFISNADYHLQSNSPAINKGIAISGIIRDYDGSALVGLPDIGAFEYLSTSTSKIYYIAPNGNDATGNGSINNPWKTLANACNQATTRGDTIHINAGTFNETTQCNLAVGVNIIGEGTTSIIKTSYIGSTIYLNSNIGEPSDGNQSISYLKIDGNNFVATRGITINFRNNVEMHHLTMSNFREGGIIFYGNNNAYPNPPSVSYMSGNSVHDCNITDSSTLDANRAANVLAEGQTGFLIYNNYFSQTNMPGEANGNIITSNWVKDFKVYNNTFTKNNNYYGPEWNFFLESWHFEGGCEIYNNTFNGAATIDLADIRKGTSTYGLKIYNNELIVANKTAINNDHNIQALDFEDHGAIQYIEVYNNHFKNVPTAIEIVGLVNENDTKVNIDHIKIYSNLFEDIGTTNSSWTFPILISGDKSDTYTGPIIWDNISIFSNTIITSNNMAYGQNRSYNGIRWYTYGNATNIIIKNNIIQGFMSYPIAFDVAGTTPATPKINNISIENNLYYNNADNSIGYGAITITNKTEQKNIIINPLFVSSSDFHLQATSPAIDNGTYVGLLYNGLAPDIGTYESNYTTTKLGNLTVNYTIGGIAIGNATNFVVPINMSINATANTNYIFNNWTILNGNCTINSPTNANTTVQINSGWCKIQANFKLIKNYYLAPNGSDNTGNGSINNPWFTINKAWIVVQAGDTIYLRGGTYVYNSTQGIIDKSGEAGNLIKIWAYPNETPVITKSATFVYGTIYGNWANGIHVQNVKYIHIKGLELTNFTQPIINDGHTTYPSIQVQDTSHAIFEQINSHHNGHGMIMRSDTGTIDDILILNCDFHHNEDPYSATKYDNADGIEIAYGGINTTITLRGCRSWSNSDDGFDNWGYNGTINYEDCWAFWNGYNDSGITKTGLGEGFKLGGSTVSNDVTLFRRSYTRCLAYGNTENGFASNNAPLKFKILNSIAYHNA